MNDENQNGQAAEVENYPLDEATISVLADIKKAQDQFESDPIVRQVRQHDITLDGQRQGALIVFLRQHKLDGNWKVAINGKELVKEKQPAQMPA